VTGIDCNSPAANIWRQAELDGRVARIEEQAERMVRSSFARYLRMPDQTTQSPVRTVPVRRLTFRAKPCYVAFGVESIAAKNRVTCTQGDHLADKAKYLAIHLEHPPVIPRNRIVLTPRIIVASLRSPELISAKKHGIPRERNSVASRFLICRTRLRSIAGSVVSPSVP
jgi:hypothetical protein